MDLYYELSKRNNYIPIFQSLRIKANKDASRLRRAPVLKAIDLEWALRSEKVIASRLCRAIKDRSYQPGCASLNQVELDKPRLVFSFSWIDRIFEALLAKLVGEMIEPHLSENLHSFRKGRSNLLAVQSLGTYVREQQQDDTEIYIARRDIATYGDTIDVALLLGQLKDILGEQSAYIWQLIERVLQPHYLQSGSTAKKTLARGLPMGFSMVPVMENLYLTPLDKALEEISGLYYSRYGDDILLASSDALLLKQATLQVETEVDTLKLCCNPSKSFHIVLNANSKSTASGFFTTPSVDYLGLNVNAQGELFISRSRLKKLKDRIRIFARRAYFSARKQKLGEEQIVNSLIQSMNLLIHRELAFPEFAFLIANATNQAELRKLDTWIAKQVVRFIHRSGHDRVFRHTKLSNLRQRGLVSLVHMKKRRYRAQC